MYKSLKVSAFALVLLLSFSIKSADLNVAESAVAESAKVVATEGNKVVVALQDASKEVVKDAVNVASKSSAAVNTAVAESAKSAAVVSVVAKNRLTNFLTDNRIYKFGSENLDKFLDSSVGKTMWTDRTRNHKIAMYVVAPVVGAVVLYAIKKAKEENAKAKLLGKNPPYSLSLDWLNLSGTPKRK